MQFFVRERKLDAVVYMRSNDIYLGLPYDVFVFTMLQELFALELGLELGRYHHMVGSLHLYEADIVKARNVLASPSTRPFIMPPMEEAGELPRFLDLEAKVRSRQPLRDQDKLSSYWCDLLDALREYAAIKEGLPPTAEHSCTSPYSEMLRTRTKRTA
jgi:thymidylate synthase